jgi:hypothetical protein
MEIAKSTKHLTLQGFQGIVKSVNIWLHAIKLFTLM